MHRNRAASASTIRIVRLFRQGTVEHHIDAVADMETMEVGEHDPLGAAELCR
jgi:hypothetical protein